MEVEQKVERGGRKGKVKWEVEEKAGKEGEGKLKAKGKRNSQRGGKGGSIIPKGMLK